MMKKWSHVIENSRKYYGTNEVNQERNNKKLTPYAAKIIVDMNKKKEGRECYYWGGNCINGKLSC